MLLHMAKKPLTTRESKVLHFIEHFQQEHGQYPTYREIQTALKLLSINSVSQYVRQMSRKGYLERDKNRGFRLMSYQPPSVVSLPLLGSIQAGHPNFTQEAEETIRLPQQLVSSPQRSFLLRVKGNSMEDAGIREGDLVIVDSAQKEKTGDVVVALLDEETTIKRLIQKDGTFYLKAESRNHQDIHPKNTWKIQGVVTGLWRKYFS